MFPNILPSLLPPSSFRFLLSFLTTMSYDLRTLQMEYDHFNIVFEELQEALKASDLTEERRIQLLKESSAVERHLEHLEREIAYTEESERFWANADE